MREIQSLVASLPRAAHRNDEPLSAFVESWAATSLAASSRKPTTKAVYAALMRSCVMRDPLGALTLSTIRPIDIECWLVRLQAGSEGNRPLSPSTIRQAFTVLRMVLESARRDGRVEDNPAASVVRPRPTRSEARYLSSTELNALLEAAAKSTRYEPLMRLLALTGLRRGEACALRWQQVDLAHGGIRVMATLSRFGGALVLTEPKSAKSRRDVPLSAAAVAVLRQVKASQATLRLKAGTFWREEGFVFTTAFGSPVDPRNVHRAVVSSARRAGLERVTTHTLRHTAASTMLESGVPLHTVSEVLGHSSISITGDVYGHVSTEGARSAMDKLAAALFAP
jgi:integrase